VLGRPRVNDPSGAANELVCSTAAENFLPVFCSDADDTLQGPLLTVRVPPFLPILSCWGLTLTYRNFIPIIRYDIFPIGTCMNEISKKFTSSQRTCKELKVNGSVRVHTWTILPEFQSLPPLISYEYSFECRRDLPTFEH
jgi:hypothetical protein